MTDLSHGRSPSLGIGKTELDRSVTIGVNGLDLRDDAGTGFDDGDRDVGPVLEEPAGHPHLASHECCRHRRSPALSRGHGLGPSPEVHRTWRKVCEKPHGPVGPTRLTGRSLGLDLDEDAGGNHETVERFNSAVVGFGDVDDSLVRANLELLA